MRRNISILLGLFAALTASTMAEVVLLDEDFSAATFQTGLVRDNTGWGLRSPSNWGITDEALTGTGQAAVGEGACGQMIPLATMGLAGENTLTVSFDYATTNEGETVYVHLWGLKENATPSTATTSIMNTGAQNGHVWDSTGAPFDLYNLGKANGAWASTIGLGSDAAVIVTGSGSYTNTFDLSTFTTAPTSLDQYDYIAIGLCRNQANATGLTTLDNIKLTADKVSVVTSAFIDPETLVMDMVSPATVVTGMVDFIYNSDTNLDVTITVSEESHDGAFLVLSTTPDTLTNKTTEIAFEIDNSRAGLANGDTATGLVTFAWVETGGATSGEITMPIRSTFGFEAGQENLFTGAISTDWDNVGNWDLGRVPGALGADLAVIESAATANVVSDFTGLYAWETVVRGAATLNIGADWLGGGNFTVGGDSESGFVNQTNGSASVAVLNIGDSTTSSNSVYTVSGGALTASASANLYANSQININGGTLTYDTDDNNDMTINGDGLLKLESGTWSSTGSAAGDLTIFNANIEVSGGTVDLNGQNRFGGDFKVIGDAASITIDRVSIVPPNLIFEFAPGGGSGLSALKCSYVGPDQSITVDGSNYNGGNAEIPLFISGNINKVAADPASAYVTTNFPAEATAIITVDTDANTAVLTVSIPGYQGWIREYGLSGEDAAEEVDYDGDSLNNLYEYASGGNPTNAADTGYASSYATVGDFFEYVYARRIDFESNLVYTAEFGTDLVYTDWSSSEVVVSPETGIIEGDADFESVTNRVDMTGKPEGFMQLLIESL